MIDILDLSLRLIATFFALLGGLWAFTRYVIEKGLIPAANLNIELDHIGDKADKKIIEVRVHVANSGSSVLLVKELRLELKMIEENDDLALYLDKKKYGRLRFPHELPGSDEGGSAVKKDCLLVPYSTFIQPGIDQKYPYVTTLSNKAEFVFANAELRYGINPSKILIFIFKISRYIGLIQFSLENISQPHRQQRVFNVKSAAKI